MNTLLDKPIDKPGYVKNNHLSRPAVTSRFKRPTLRHGGQPYCLICGLASEWGLHSLSCYQNSGGLLHHLSILTITGGLFLLH